MKRKIFKIAHRSVEHVNHFRCKTCDKWWSVGDAPKNKKIWHCPWCGKKDSYATA